MPRIDERRVRLTDRDARNLVSGDSLDIGEGQPHPPCAMRSGLDPVGIGGTVDIKAENLHTVIAGVIEDEPLRIHARVMREDPCIEGCRVMSLQPGRLVGRQREGCGMRLAEAERGE